MSRYIDAEWLKELYQPYESYNGKELAVPIGAILANIDDAPTIDAVEVVRCKDCKNWVGGDTCWGIPFSGDDASYIGTEANDFCSYGERRDRE